MIIGTWNSLSELEISPSFIPEYLCKNWHCLYFWKEWCNPFIFILILCLHSVFVLFITFYIENLYNLFFSFLFPWKIYCFKFLLHIFICVSVEISLLRQRRKIFIPNYFLSKMKFQQFGETMSSEKVLQVASKPQPETSRSWKSSTTRWSATLSISFIPHVRADEKSFPFKPQANETERFFFEEICSSETFNYFAV